MEAPEPTCERVTWRPGKGGARNWVCSDEEGKCQWCRDEEWHGYWRQILDAHNTLVERAQRDITPYRLHFKASELPSLLVAEYGSAAKAVEAVLSVPYEDFYRHLPTLLAWDLPNVEASRRWYELLAKADELSGATRVAS